MADVHGEAPLSDVSYSISEGVYKPPTPEEASKIIEETARTLDGHGTYHPVHFIGTLNPFEIVKMGYAIHPSMTEVNTYRIHFEARNGGVEEVLEVRFNPSVRIWQSRCKVMSRRLKDANKIILNQDWLPKKPMPIPVGE